ncbi:hypothetical protein vseg_003503 [Gypsophila vaccaria]
MTAITHLRFSPLSTTSNHLHHHRLLRFSTVTFRSTLPPNLNLNLNLNHNSSLLFPLSFASGGGNGDSGNFNGGHGGGGGNDGDSDDSSWFEKLGIIGMFIKGWRERVAADPQFPFKVLMEEVVGLTSCVLGDMASRPNFGLNELDFVFSTLVVGSILNFTLMYLLAPTATATAAAGKLPGLFAACPAGHMFEPGSFGLASRLGTFVYKGAVFAAVGFAAGLVGTAVSNGLIAVRKKMDPEFETPNKPPPTLLNAVTWALHMGISSNFRYQALNGVEYVLAKAVPATVFKSSVIGLRCANNVLGGMSFVVLARLTGSQSVAGSGAGDVLVVAKDEEKENLVVAVADGVASNQST